MPSLRGLSPETYRKLILSVGTHRTARPLSPIEVAEAMEVSIAAGAALQEVATALQFEGTTMIGRFRRLLTLSPGVRHIVSWGTGPASISLTVASEVARLKSPKAHEEITKATLEHELRSGEVRQIVQIVQRSKTSVAEAIEAVVQQRPQIMRRHLMIGAILSDKVIAAIRGMSQRERDQLLEDALGRYAPTLPTWTGHLGGDRFSLIGGDDFAVAIQKLPNGFEATVNACLEKEVS